MDYVTRLENALKIAAFEINRLQAENARLRNLAIEQVDLSLGVVNRYAGTISELEEIGAELQRVVDQTISRMEIQ